MEQFDVKELKKLYIPAKDSHKGQNGKLTIVGGSYLFHGPSLWALKVASRIVDMVFYSSIDENNEIVQKLKSEIYDFIAVPREKLDGYIKESDSVLIGPGLPRENGREKDDESTKELTERLLKTNSNKKWVIDAGSLTEMETDWLLPLNGNAILTPHAKEFAMLFGIEASLDNVKSMAKQYNCTILLKGQKDYVVSSSQEVMIEGGNAGMTKGGTGDVLAGLVAALSCKNELFLAAACASFINKKAGESLYEKVGVTFNASDLADEIPKVMKELLV